MYSQQIQPSLPSPSKLFTPGVCILLALMVTGAIFTLINGQFALASFAVSSQSILSGRIWQLATYSFISGSIMNLVFSSLMVVFVGSAVEREWRTVSFLALWLVVSVACGLLWAIVDILTAGTAYGIGAAACTYGLISAMALLYRGRRFFLFFAVVPASYMVIILIIIGILMNLTQPLNLIWIIGAPVGFLYIKLLWKINLRSARSATVEPNMRTGGFVDID